MNCNTNCVPTFQQGAFYTKSTTSATFQLAAKEYDPPLSQIIGVYDHTQNKAKDFLHVREISYFSVELMFTYPHHRPLPIG